GRKTRGWLGSVGMEGYRDMCSVGRAGLEELFGDHADVLPLVAGHGRSLGRREPYRNIGPTGLAQPGGDVADAVVAGEGDGDSVAGLLVLALGDGVGVLGAGERQRDIGLAVGGGEGDTVGRGARKALEEEKGRSLVVSPADANAAPRRIEEPGAVTRAAHPEVDQVRWCQPVLALHPEEAVAGGPASFLAEARFARLLVVKLEASA